jgi:hypothetical protein
VYKQYRGIHVNDGTYDVYYRLVEADNRETNVLRGFWFKDGELVEERRVPVITPPMERYRLQRQVLRVMHRGIALNDKEFLLFTSSAFEGESYVRVTVLRSEDGGRSFRYLSTVATRNDAPWGNEGPNESSTVLLPGGELFCMMRTGSDPAHAVEGHPMLSARSSDGGKTWHSHKWVKQQGVFPNMCLLDNGVLLCTVGRPGNYIMCSSDYGKTWSRLFEITGKKYRTTGYMDVAAIDDDTAICVFHASGYLDQDIWLWDPPPKRNIIGCVQVHARP